VFSRNASSSRAIPVATMIDQVLSAPAMPERWGLNSPGMQSKSECSPREELEARRLWVEASENAVSIARAMSALGLHKQVVNRVLEPFQYIHVVVTATEWANFFDLRCHPDAQPELRSLAESMRGAIGLSKPVAVGAGGWHLPYIQESERDSHSLECLKRASAARCARVSYLTHDGKSPCVEDDLRLYDRLAGSRPLHASPLEHQATPDTWAGRREANFRGWVQFRRYVEESS
jgi:thymidylate synthase ThyX